MRVGIEALWRVAEPRGRGDGSGEGAASAPNQEGRRTLSGWDRDMPEVGGREHTNDRRAKNHARARDSFPRRAWL